jgi:outer membrane protein assembly factor BamB
MAKEKSPLKWEFETGSTVNSPAVVDGVVYFGSRDNHLYAVDIQIGAEKWKFETGGVYTSSPAVSDGVVYIGSFASWVNYLYAVDTKTGEEKWKFKTGDKVLSSPAVSDGVVYFGCSDKHLYALDTKIGKEKWKFKTKGEIYSSPTLSDGVVYFGSNDHHLYALNANTGEEKWKFETGDSVRSSPAVSEGVVYFGSSDNHLYAVDSKTGEEKWKFKTGGYFAFSSPAVSDGVVYFGSSDNHLYALDMKTGKEKWKFETEDSIDSSPTVLAGVVYFGSDDSHLYALDSKTGEEKWKFETGGNVRSSPSVLEGVVYFGSRDNHLYAVDIEAASALGKEELNIQEEADKHGVTEEDIRIKYISGEITLEEAIELQTQDQKRKEELNKLKEEADKHGVTEEDIKTKYICGEITLEEAIELQTQHLKEEQKRQKEAGQKEKELEQKRKEEEQRIEKQEAYHRLIMMYTEKERKLTQTEILEIIKTESIGSELISSLSEETDLDDINREIVDLKLKLGELRRDNEGSDNYKWLQDALLSITDWGTDIFEALYKDEDVHIRNAVAMNPSLPESILIELSNDSDKRVKLSVLSNSSCPKDLLIKGSEDTENYASSRVRRAAALNKNAPKAIIDKLLKDEYRWVREAASSHKSVKGKKISDLVKSADDRYILKGLLENPNCTDGIKSVITDKLEDENKYPIETDTYIIKNWGCGEYTGGSMTVEEMADAIVESDGSSLPGEYYQYVDIYHCFGDYDLNENILMPDGTSEKLNLTLETDITDCGADFVMNASTSESGEVGNYEIELEDLFDPTKLTVSEEYGLVEGYEYDGDYFEGESEGESTPGDGYSLPSLDIQVKAGGFYEDFDLESEISVMEDEGVDVSDAEAVLKYLKDTYGL